MGRPSWGISVWNSHARRTVQATGSAATSRTTKSSQSKECQRARCWNDLHCCAWSRVPLNELECPNVGVYSDIHAAVAVVSRATIGCEPETKVVDRVQVPVADARLSRSIEDRAVPTLPYMVNEGADGLVVYRLKSQPSTAAPLVPVTRDWTLMNRPAEVAGILRLHSQRSIAAWALPAVVITTADATKTCRPSRFKIDMFSLFLLPIVPTVNTRLEPAPLRSTCLRQSTTCRGFAVLQTIDPSSPQEFFVCQITRLHRQKKASGVAHAGYPCDFTRVSGRCLHRVGASVLS